MQQILSRTPMLKCDLNNVALQLCWNHTLTWVFSCKFARYFQNTSWRATSSSTVCCYKWIEIKHHYSRKEYSVECKVSECEDINTWKSVLCVNENVLLIFPAPCIAERSVKIRINSYFLCVASEGCTANKCENEDLSLFFCLCSRLVRVGWTNL